MLKLGVAIGILGGAMLVGCAASPPPNTNQIAHTSHAIGSADGARAANVPAASYYLVLAKEQSAAAQRYNADGQYQRATMLLRRADADAQLALALARESAQRAEAQKAMDRVHELQIDQSAR